jgi:hypothetical protein
MPRLKLYKLKQDHAQGYDAYDSCVVAAEDEATAKTISASDYSEPLPCEHNNYEAWACKPEQVTATLIGDATEGIEPGVIVASFNAG